MKGALARFRRERRLKSEEALQRQSELCDRIVMMLDDRGPSTAEDLRNRLCVASASLFQEAVRELLRSKRAQSSAGCYGTVLRLPGDRRPNPRTLSDLDRKPGSLGVRMAMQRVVAS